MYTLDIYPLGRNFAPLSLYGQPFSRCKAVENWKNRKCAERPQNDLDHLTVQDTLYTLSNYP